MVSLPSGTVTFLLTDVEASTVLWEQFPDAMRAALARHDALFERAVATHGGVHIRPRGEGDSRFAVFVSGADAVSAALAMQQDLLAEPWPTPRPIKVRIGIHTGEAQLRDGDYYGSAVNRCARLRGLGHGGQVLLSEATAALVQDDLPAGAGLVDHGQHVLKGLARPERVFQVTLPDLPLGPAPLDPVETRRAYLPSQTTALVGREREVEQIRALLLAPEVRLLTLTGPGGTGKTRLASHLGAEMVDAFADGVFFVDLAPISDPALIASTIAPILGVANRGEHLLDDVKQVLASRRLLLILDNFEQIVAGAPLVTELLAASPGLKTLVTSRAALQVRGEQELAIPPLPVPAPDIVGSPDDLRQYGAIALFVERARAVRPDFVLTPANAAAVATICARLDGLPLALELAAARVRLLPPEAMVRRLEHRLPLLTGGARDLPARQRTLRDTITWSYDLLAPDEQRMFRALGVFVGGFTLDAIEAIVGDGSWVRGDGGATSDASSPNTHHPTPNTQVDTLDLLASLVAQSLVRQTDAGDGEPRFGMLETIREYALEQLEAHGETTALRDRHLAWCVALAERANQHLDGPEWLDWVNRLEADFDNMRAALAWSTSDAPDPDLGIRVAGALGAFWSMRGYLSEGRAWLARVLARSSARTLPRAQALARAAYLAMRQSDFTKVEGAFEESLSIQHELGDLHGVIMTLRSFGIAMQFQRELDRARALLEESVTLARQVADDAGLRTGIRALADLALERAEYPQAADWYEQSLALAREHGDLHATANALRGLGHVARARGDYGEARHFLSEGLRLFARLRDQRCTPICLEGIACTEVGPDWAVRAVRLFGATQALQQRTGAPASPSEMADYRRTELDARAALGEERYAEIMAAGAAMTLDEAIEYALTPDARPSQDPPRRPVTEPLQGLMAADVPLSPREREVVTLIAEGRSNREIAEALTLSVRTVERHIENVYNRLGISGKAGRAIVTAYALRRRLIAPV